MSTATRLFFSLVIAIAAVSQSVCHGMAQETEIRQEALPVQTEGNQDKTEVPPVGGYDPQFPIYQTAYDGVMYTYHTDCCVDGHYGVYLSEKRLTLLGCKVANAVTMPVAEIPLNIIVDPDGGEPEPAKARLFVSDGIVDKGMPEVFGLFSNNKCMFNYYPSSSPFGTAIKLKDALGNTRVFTLVQYRDSGKLTVTNPDGSTGQVDFSIDFPLLILSRNNPERLVAEKFGRPFKVFPTKMIPATGEIEIADTAVDFSKNYFGQVTITLEDPMNPTGTVERVCIVINRPDGF